MPKYKRTVRYYTCEYKCGSQALPKESMLRHEEICFCNPKNKACRICEYAVFGEYKSSCRKLRLNIKNDNRNMVFNIDGEEVWSALIPFNYTERPFPKNNCDLFKKSKKHY